MSSPEDLKKKEEAVKQGLIARAKAWGDSSLPPAALATLIFPQHARPLQLLPMLFPPVFMLSSYLNLNGYKRDAAGISGAWAALYLLLASRRKPRSFVKKFGTRGILRGATLALCAVQVGAGGVSYAFGQKGRSEDYIGKPKQEGEGGS